jgi:hypothetical protein
MPALPADKVKVINTLKMGTMDKIFLQFEKPFWDLQYPGLMFLHTPNTVNPNDFFDNIVTFHQDTFIEKQLAPQFL